jgi:hypothetical protein
MAINFDNIDKNNGMNLMGKTMVAKKISKLLESDLDNDKV